MKSLAESELSNISKWMLANGITLHSNKTLALNISLLSRVTTTLELTLTLHNVKINTQSVAKYLGILIDDEFSFKSQITHLKSKISRSVGVIAKLRYYLPPETLLNLYFALVHSHLLYGQPVWASTCRGA